MRNGKQVLRGDVALRFRELVCKIGRFKDIEIITGHMSPDHVHLLNVPTHDGVE